MRKKEKESSTFSVLSVSACWMSSISPFSIHRKSNIHSYIHEGVSFTNQNNNPKVSLSS